MKDGLFILRDKKTGQLCAGYRDFLGNGSERPWDIIGCEQGWRDEELDLYFDVVCEILDNRPPSAGLYLVRLPLVEQRDPLVTHYSLAEFKPPPTEDESGEWELTDDEHISWLESNLELTRHGERPMIGFRFPEDDL